MQMIWCLCLQSVCDSWPFGSAGAAKARLHMLIDRIFHSVQKRFAIFLYSFAPNGRDSNIGFEPPRPFRVYTRSTSRSNPLELPAGQFASPKSFVAAPLGEGRRSCGMPVYFSVERISFSKLRMTTSGSGLRCGKTRTLRYKDRRRGWNR